MKGLVAGEGSGCRPRPLQKTSPVHANMRDVLSVPPRVSMKHSGCRAGTASCGWCTGGIYGSSGVSGQVLIMAYAPPTHKRTCKQCKANQETWDTVLCYRILTHKAMNEMKDFPGLQITMPEINKPHRLQFPL